MPLILLIPLIFVVAGTSAIARADEPIRDLAELHTACRDAELPGRRKLYAVEVPQARFEPYYEEDGALVLDTRRNFRVLRGTAEIFASNLEPIAFVANARRADELARRGRSLRVGFFLGFDESHRRPCLIRSAVSVTMVRADLAFVELLDAEGEVVAREDTDRLRAWQDDLERDGIPGQGPRAAVLHPSSVRGGTLPEPYVRALSTEALRNRLSACARQRNETGDAQVVAVLQVGADGSVAQVEVELSSARSQAVEACVVDALRSARFAPGAPTRLRAPVHLTQ